MSESAFSQQCRMELHNRYYPRGIWWLNSTGYEMHHDPFPSRGAGDLLGAICGKWCEIELKTATGRMRELQLKRQALCLRLGLIYLVVRSINELRAKVDEHDDKNWNGHLIVSARTLDAYTRPSIPSRQSSGSVKQ